MSKVLDNLISAGLNGLAFLIYTVIVVLGIMVVVSFCVHLSRSGRQKKKKIEVEDLGKNLENYLVQLKKKILGKKHFEKWFKKFGKEQKNQEKKRTLDDVVYVLDFNGDVKASQVEKFREEISAVLEVASVKDEIVIRLESRGGVVHGYGLAASQLKRIRDRKIPLTVCVDKVAASGGYMMACIADKIISAPFAIVGSIGVLASVPNFHRFLKKNDIDYEELTAGEYKRTISLFGEITEKARDKHLKDIEDVHELFKTHVKEHRRSLDISKVSTGEYWFGLRAKNLNLVDELLSSDDYIGRRIKEGKKVYSVRLHVHKNLSEKIAEKMESRWLGASLTNRMRRMVLPSYELKKNSVKAELFSEPWL